jgi:phage shock protein E
LKGNNETGETSESWKALGTLAGAVISFHDPGMKLAVFLACMVLATDLRAAEETAPIKIEQADKQLADGVELLDVRTQSEWNEGHLQGAKLVPLAKDGFLDKAKAALDPKKPVLVYCKSGGRSAKAAKQLREAGFTVYDLAGGITAWQKAGKPVVK